MTNNKPKTKKGMGLMALSLLGGLDGLDTLLPPRKKKEEKVVTENDLLRLSKAEEKRKRKAEKLRQSLK